jgi:hypothetical protein
VNFTSDDAAERVRQAYTESQWTRLTALKAKYDPTNFFRMNANILAGWPSHPPRDAVRAGYLLGSRSDRRQPRSLDGPNDDTGRRAIVAAHPVHG